MANLALINQCSLLKELYFYNNLWTLLGFSHSKVLLAKGFGLLMQVFLSNRKVFARGSNFCWSLMVQLQSNQLGLLLLHDMSCRACCTLGQSNKDCKETSRIKCVSHGLWTPNEGINQRNLEILDDVADKICFGRT